MNTSTLGPRHILRAAPAQNNHLSDDAGDAYAQGSPIDLSLFTHASVQLVWAGLTGTLDGALTVEVSDNRTDWVNKGGALIAPTSAAGNESISLNGVVTERFYRVRWVKNGVTGGTVNCYILAKG